MADMVRIEGVKELFAALDEFDRKVQDDAMRAGLRAAGGVMQAAVIAAAPVLDKRTANSTALPPGALKSDIAMRVTGRSGTLMAIVEPGKLTYHVARWVEYGHMLTRHAKLPFAPGKRKGKAPVVGHVPAHPFVRPAFDHSAAASVGAFVEGFKAVLRKRG